MNDVRAAARWTRLAVICLGCALSACTSLHVVERPSGDAVARDYDPRDRVVVVTRDGQRVDLRVTQATLEGLTGTDAGGGVREIPVDQIERIEMRRFSGWKTAGLALLVVAAGIAHDIHENGVINSSGP